MKLFFRKLGEGTPIIILHGLLGASDNWFTIGKQLAESRCVYIVDLRNHGQSPHHDTMDYREMAQDIRELMEDEDIRQPILLGHSLGGKVAMTLALLIPSKISKLIVVDIAPKIYTTDYFENLIRALFSLELPRISSRKEADEKLREKIPDPIIRQFLLKNLERGESGEFSWKANLPVIYHHLPNVVDDIDSEGVFEGPALFVRGEKSAYVLDEDLPKIRSLFPQAQLITVAGAGHWVHSEAPGLFWEAIRKFL
jgi:pimeloyl-ACP methyl ester carboxylesterase